MKYVLIIILAIALLLSQGCGKKVELIEEWVDLSGWNEVIYHYPANGQGRGSWELSNNNQWATQKINGDPTILVSDIDISGTTVEGSWLMKGNNDDDLVGFVFGYQDPGHFYLLDWKMQTQDDNACGLAEQGISIKTVAADYSGPESGVLEASQPFDDEDLWNTEGTEGKVTLLHHEETEGWEFEKEYEFILRFDPGSFTVTIKDGEETIFCETLNDTTYQNGKFGFYNFSQAPVVYKGFKTITVISPSHFPWWIVIVAIALLLTAFAVFKKKRGATHFRTGDTDN